MRLTNLFTADGEGADRAVSALPLSEGTETQRGIEMVADALIRAAAEKCAPILRDKVKRDGAEWDDFDPEDMGAVNFNDAFPKLRRGVPPKIANFIRAMRQSYLRVAFTASRGPYGSYNGWYSSGRPGRQPEIMLHLAPEQFDPLVDLAKTGRLTIPALHHTLRALRGTLVHEVTHAYDDWVSKGRYEFNKRSDAAHDARIARMISPNNPEKVERANRLYMNDPVEVNARFTQTVAKIDLDRDKPWREYFGRFRYEMLGWHKLPAQVKDRLTRRLAAYWQEGRPVVDHTLREAVKRAQTRIREATGLEVWLSVQPEVKALSVSSFGTKNRKVAIEMLKTLAVFADVKGLTLAAPLPPGPDVRELGFVNQRSNKQDFSLPLGTRIYRRPRPRAQR